MKTLDHSLISLSSPKILVFIEERQKRKPVRAFEERLKGRNLFSDFFCFLV